MNISKILNFIIKYSIYLLVFLMPLFWLPWTFEGYEFNKQYLLVFLVALAFWAWLAKMIISKKRLTFLRSWLDLFILIFALLTIFSAVFSIDKFSSWFGFYGRFSDSAIGILALILFYFVLVNNLRSEKKEIAKVQLEKATDSLNDLTGQPDLSEKKEIKKRGILSAGAMIKLFMISGFIAVAITYFSLFGILARLPGLPNLMKVIVFNPAAASSEGLAMFLVVLTTLSVLLFLNRGKLWLAKDKNGSLEEEGSTKRNGWLGKFFNFLVLIASFILLMIINFSFAWLVFLIVMFFLLLLVIWLGLLRQRVNLLILPIILVLLSIAGYFGLFNQTGSWFGLNPLSNELFLDYQTAKSITVDSIKNYSILGSGPGTFLADFSKFKPLGFNETQVWNVRFDRAPSQLMEMFSTNGVLGIIFYLAVIVFLALFILPFLLIKKLLDLNNKSKRLSLLSFFVLCLALFAIQVVYPQIMVLAFSFWFFVALAVVGLDRVRPGFLKEKSFSFKDLPEIGLVMNILLLVLFFALLGLFYLGGRFYCADIKYTQAIIKDQTEGDNLIKEVAADLEKAVNLDKYVLNYRMALSRVYLRIAWLEASKPENERDLQLLQSAASSSIQQARLASQLFPDSVMSWENLGLIYRDSMGLIGGTAPFALDSFSKASELEPTNPLFFRERCRINLLTNDSDWEKTLNLCKKAIELKQTYLDAHIQLAMAYEQKGDLNEALKSLQTALDKLKGVSFQRGSALASVVSEIYFQIGRVYFNLDQITDAEKMFTQSVIVTPQYANARYGLAVCYQKQGKPKDALTQFEIINQLVPGNQVIEQAIQQLGGKIK